MLDYATLVTECILRVRRTLWIPAHVEHVIPVRSLDAPVPAIILMLPPDTRSLQRHLLSRRVSTTGQLDCVLSLRVCEVYVELSRPSSRERDWTSAVGEWT